MTCQICGTTHRLDRHHVIPRGMGGSRNPEVQAESNLLTLCRDCHRKVHQGPWELERSAEVLRVWDRNTGEQVMRRHHDPVLDVPGLFQKLNLVEDFLSRLSQSLPFLLDDQLVEAFAYATSLGKRAWLIQAAVLYEAQQRSAYGDQALESIARRFEISLRQAQKYALAWKTFFQQDGLKEKNVNIDAFLLDQPSWYLVAATETQQPDRWLAYAQDRKVSDPTYSIANFRDEIRKAKIVDPASFLPTNPGPGVALPQLERSGCPWIREFCTLSGRPQPRNDCSACEFQNLKNCETKPNSVSIPLPSSLAASPPGQMLPQK